VELNSERELVNTREKLRQLELVYNETLREPCEDSELRDAELESMMRIIIQFKKEISRFEIRQTVRR